MTTMTDDEYRAAVKQGHEVALALAVKRFRDEYRWTLDMVKGVGHELMQKIDDGVTGELDRMAADLTRIEMLGGGSMKLHCSIIAAMALVGAQVSEGLELSRRSARN